jgi:glycerol-3-phosphate acyltransferase PlsY
MELIMLPLLGLCAYFLGSVSCALVLSRCANLPDPRLSGSKNPGATNMLRISGFRYGLLTFAGDALKAIVPVCIARLVGLDALDLAIIGLLAFVGHVFPVYYHFKGGKGVATGFGCVCAFSPALALMLLSVWLVVYAATRYVALASIIAFTVLPIMVSLIYSVAIGVVFTLMALVVIGAHSGNIKRLINGLESKTYMFSR